MCCQFFRDNPRLHNEYFYQHDVVKDSESSKVYCKICGKVLTKLASLDDEHCRRKTESIPEAIQRLILVGGAA